jgi:nucleoside-diphosphate-sugar epimerase
LNFRENMERNNNILITGATGYIGLHVAKVNLSLDHSTFILVRDSTTSSNPEKAQLLDSFKASRDNILVVS